MSLANRTESNLKVILCLPDKSQNIIDLKDEEIEFKIEKSYLTRRVHEISFNDNQIDGIILKNDSSEINLNRKWFIELYDNLLKEFYGATNATNPKLELCNKCFDILTIENKLQLSGKRRLVNPDLYCVIQ